MTTLWSFANAKLEPCVFFAQIPAFRYRLREFSFQNFIIVHESNPGEMETQKTISILSARLSSDWNHPSGIIEDIMVALEETINVPLAVTEHGTIRIKGSRVSLDSIVHHFNLGATAEQIVQSFPSLSLGDVYSSIAYYLTHRQEIEEYLKEQETTADAVQEQLPV